MVPEFDTTVYPKAQKGYLKLSTERSVRALTLLTILIKQQLLLMRNNCEKLFL